MARLIKKTQNNYTNVSNQLIRDERLSWKARGIFIYLWSQSDEWNFYVSEIAKHATDGEKSLRSGIKELENFGYLTRKNRQKATGGFDGMDWILTDQCEKEHHARNSGDTKMAENNPKTSQKGVNAETDENQANVSLFTSDAKSVERKMCRTQNGRLRNNNSKNYQYKELPINKSSSSTSKKDDDEPDFEQKITDRMNQLWKPIRTYQIRNHQNSNPSLSQLQQIRLRVSELSDVSFKEINRDFSNQVSSGFVENPYSYLLVMLQNGIAAEKYWNQLNN